MQKFKTYRDSIDIDYYVYFTKAYFAFNAYLKAKYPDNNDREKINNIKGDTVLLSKFKNLISSGKHFSDDLISLKNSLDIALIQNQSEYVLFSKVMVYNHRRKILFNESYRTISYDIRAIDGEKFTFNVNGQNPNPFKFDELETILEDTTLSSSQQTKIRNEINGFVASYSIDLTSDIESVLTLNTLSRTEQDEILLKLYRGFIEILYTLRNSLFHSEVIPNEDVMKVYKFAYFILRKIVHKIPT